MTFFYLQVQDILIYLVEMLSHVDLGPLKKEEKAIKKQHYNRY